MRSGPKKGRRELMYGLVALVVLGGGPRAMRNAVGGEPPLKLSIDKEKVDLEAGCLEVRLSRPASRVSLEVLGGAGEVLAKVDQRFSNVKANQPLLLRWPVKKGRAVARIEVFGYDLEQRFVGVAISPWSFEVPHEEVVFRSGSAQIDESEQRKLRASLVTLRQLLSQHRELGEITLFVAAHTDTVGAADYNLRLSSRRAQAIARWFRDGGLQLPIAHAGLGEQALAVPTADEVPEARNRRADYMLALEPPRLRVSGRAVVWRKP